MRSFRPDIKEKIRTFHEGPAYIFQLKGDDFVLNKVVMARIGEANVPVLFEVMATTGPRPIV